GSCGHDSIPPTACEDGTILPCEPRPVRDPKRDFHLPFSVSSELTLKQRILRSRKTMPARNFEVVKGTLSSDAAARSAVEKTKLHQIRLVNFLDGIRLLVDGCRNRAEAH